MERNLLISETSTQAPAGASRPAALIATWLAPVIVFALVTAMVVITAWTTLASGHLTDTDSYTRLIRVHDLLNTGLWFSDAYPHTNAPFGDTLHWTRPLDVMIIAMSAPFSPFLDLRTAVHLGGLVLIPLTHLMAAFVLMWAAAPVLKPSARILAAVLLLTHPVVLSYATPGRIDHHILLLLLFVATMGMAIRAAIEYSSDPRRWLAIGAVAGLGLWVSVEFMPAAAALGTVIWARGFAESSSDARRGLPYSIGLAASSVVALLVERGISGALTIEYDRISIAHVYATLVAFASFAALTTLEPRGPTLRVLVSFVVACSGGATLLYLFPRFLAGPVADLDPVVEARLLDLTIEMQPLWNGAAGIAVWHRVALVAAALLAATGLIWALARPGDGRAWAWRAVAAYFMLYFFLTSLQWRWGTYLGAIAAIPFAELLQRSIDVLDRRRSERVRLYAYTFLPLIAIVAPFAAGAIASPARHQPAADAEPTCRVSAAIDALADRARFPAGRIVVTELGVAPALIYLAGHRAIGSPYHRNAAGLHAALALEDAQEPREAHRLLIERKVDYILLCRRSITPTTFAWITASPRWLVELPLTSGDAGGYRFFQVDRSPQ